MMFYLHRLSDQVGGLNVFFYVTFRAVAAAVTAFGLSLVFGNFVIRKLISLKIGQPIRSVEEVRRLAELHGGKQGTPTMGGVLVIGAVFLASVLWARPDNRFVWLVLFSMLYLGVLGFLDDYLKVTKKKSDGIPGRVKLAAQLLLAAVVTVVFLTSPLLQVQARSLYLPFFKVPVITNMGWFTLIFFAVVIVGSSNAVNLTDGLDGLAIGCTVTVALAYAFLSYAAGNFKIAEYLQVPFYPFTGELTVVCAALVGAGLGFLWFNCYPAKVFMGDTGSLSIGGMIGVVAICCKQEFLLAVVGGPAAETNRDAYDLAVLSPGIDPDSPLAQNFSSRNIEMIGELELGWQFCAVPLVAITGTNGKTTTTELVAQMLNACGQRTVACGNIGKPLSEVVRHQSKFDVLTAEVSSFQLETIKTFRPQIAVWLNFAPDHLDSYASVAEYHAAKLRIFEYQTEKEFAVVNASDYLPQIKAHRLTFSAYDDRADFRLADGTICFERTPVLRLADAKLRGSHNIENLMATLAVGHIRGLAFEQMAPPLCAYEPAPHSCEFVRTIGGVDYINDSKATNLDAAEKALQAQTKPVVLIAGGKDKGFDFQPLRDLVKKKAHTAILLGEMANRIADDWREATRCEIARSLADAVERARAAAKTGDVVLFSPGTSSFDMFKSYADRGDQFRRLVHALPK